jgi:hypothetical protein
MGIERSGGVAHAAEMEAPPSSGSARLPAVAYLSVGQIVADRYEIAGVLGEGGMGVVYRCRDRGGDFVALKRIILPPARAQEHLYWFVAEAQAIAGLEHDNIVRARDFGQLRDGTPYLVMDLVEGVSLQQLALDRTSFPLLWLLIDQVLAALAHAHARGVVHGDLKPTNILVEADARRMPRVRLFDFGLAKRRRARLDARLGQRSAPSHPPPSAGTPGYMAPEQILGRTSEIGHATDLYALGCVLYRLLSGRTPFGGKAERELDLHCFSEPIPLAPVIEVPAGVIEIVMRLLSKHPSERAASAAHVRNEWNRFRPERLPEFVASLNEPATDRAPAAHVDDTLEVTRRISPAPPPADAMRLGRSRRWLPGLLSVRPPPLVGRTNLCRDLATTFREVASAPAPLQSGVVLSGVAGVGKSRVADWLCTHVEEHGTGLVLRGVAASPSVARDGLRIALADYFQIDEQAPTLPAVLAERCDPADLAGVVDFILNDDPHARSVPALLRVLHAVSEGRPILLWLDDPKHVGAATRALLRQVAHNEPALSMVVITTVQPEAFRDSTVADMIGTLRASLPTRLMRVPALDSLTMSAMLQAALPMDPALALRIALDSDGVPLDGLRRLYTFVRRGSSGAFERPE